MNIKKWLKTILLFPAMLMLGNLDAGAEPVEDPAEDLGNQGEENAGTEPDDQAAELDGEEADESNDSQEAAEDKPAKGKQPHQTTLEERAAQIAQKEIQKFREEQAEIQRQTEARLKPETKPFIDLSPEQSTQINNDYVAAISRKVELEEAIRLGDREPATITELRRTEKWIHDTESWFADNEAKKSAWAEQQEIFQKQQALAKESADRLSTTAEVFREANKIPQDVWDTSAVWFSMQMETDKVLQLEFQDAYRLHGDVGAVRFAHKYCNENMGKTAEQAISQKTEAKKNLAPGVTSTATTADQDVSRLYKEAMADPNNQDKYMAWQTAKAKTKK